MNLEQAEISVRKPVSWRGTLFFIIHMVHITLETHSDTVESSLNGVQEDLGCKWNHILCNNVISASEVIIVSMIYDLCCVQVNTFSTQRRKNGTTIQKNPESFSSSQIHYSIVLRSFLERCHCIVVFCSIICNVDTMLIQLF